LILKQKLKVALATGQLELLEPAGGRFHSDADQTVGF